MSVSERHRRMDAAMKEVGFNYAVVVKKDVSVFTVGARIAYFRIQSSAEDAYVAEINRVYAELAPDSHALEEI
jgi:hypothetical protein